MKDGIKGLLKKATFYLEIMAVLGFLIGLALLIAENKDAQFTMGISLTTLAIIYFLNGFNENQEMNSGLGKMTDKLIWISASVAVVGSMFFILNLPGSNAMMVIGVASLILSLLLYGILFLAKKDDAGQVRPASYRAILIILWILLLYFGSGIFR